MISSAAVTFHQPFDYVLYQVSYANLILYSTVLLSDSTETKGDVINGDDPTNRDDVRKSMFELDEE